MLQALKIKQILVPGTDIHANPCCRHCNSGKSIHQTLAPDTQIQTNPRSRHSASSMSLSMLYADHVCSYAANQMRS